MHNFKQPIARAGGWAAAAATAALLAGCFGGSSDTDPLNTAPPVVDTTTVPTSAGATTASFLAYLKTLPTNETSEPKLIDPAFTAAVSETAEPEPV